MQQVINKMKKTPVVDNNGDYNLKYNMQNLTEDFFLTLEEEIQVLQLIL